ncbi:MAG: cytidine deaminase [Nitrospirae bacterium]|nr:MAG: cytidine deaminase [Nitrospirota bacterium]
MIDPLRLYTEAEKALTNAGAETSGFRVGAAVVDETGRVFTGCNQENPSITQVICAERLAIFKALSEGAKSIKAVLILSEFDEYCYPCGSCRQLIFEYGPDAQIYITSGRGIMRYSITELLPNPFVRK